MNSSPSRILVFHIVVRVLFDEMLYAFFSVLVCNLRAAVEKFRRSGSAATARLAFQLAVCLASERALQSLAQQAAQLALGRFLASIKKIRMVLEFSFVIYWQVGMGTPLDV